MLSCHRHSSSAAQGIAPLVVAGHCCTVQQHCVVSAVFSLCVYEREVCVEKIVPREFDRTAARPRTIDYRTIEGPLLYPQFTAHRYVC